MKAESIRKTMNPWSQKIGKFFGSFAGPNFYTGLTLLFGFIAAYEIASNQIVGAVIALLLWGFFDWVDGAVARSQNKSTVFGIVLDSTVDKVSETAIYLGFMVSAAAMLWPAILAMAAFLLASYESKVGYEIGVAAQGGIAERRERFFLILLAIVALGFGSLGLGIAAGLLYLLALLSTITFLQRIWWIRQKAGKKGEKDA